MRCVVLFWLPPQLNVLIRKQLHFPAMSDYLSNNDHNYNRRLRRNRRWWMRPVFFRRRQDGNRLLDDIKAEMVNDTIKNFMRMKHEDFDQAIGKCELLITVKSSFYTLLSNFE